jgi:tubulin--tyrosine ligase
MKSGPVTALISWPTAPLTDSLVRKALASVYPPLNLTSTIPDQFEKLIQWSTYDDLDHELTHTKTDAVLSSSYTIRKALIRKHYLAHAIRSYLSKHPNSFLATAVPRTWELEISFADELDEKWGDELWDLGEELVDPMKWWILKPGMADRGNGIRMFNSKYALQRIFEQFEENEEEEQDDEEETTTTAVVTSQLRHFVIQVCIAQLT